LELPAKSRFVISEKGATETAFPIHETNYPSVIPEPFLLIFRTSHIVTALHDQMLRIACNRWL
jgi:hypothetical protein